MFNIFKPKVKGGLEPFKEDARDFNYGSITELGAADLSKLPDSFDIPVMDFYSQKSSDMCTGFATAQVSEDQEGVELHKEFAFMAGKKMRGNWANWGNDVRSPMKAAVKWGTIKKSDAPDMVLAKKSRNFLANWNNWPNEVWDKAKLHKKHSFFKINDRSAGNKFDSIRLALWENKDKKRSVMTAATWRGSWNHPRSGIIPETYPAHGVGHMFEIVGWVKLFNQPYLKIYPNYGKGLGKGGFLYMSKSVANRELMAAYMFVDIPLDIAKIVNEYAGKAVISNVPPKIYLIDKGVKKHIPNMDLFNALGFIDKQGEGGYVELPESVMREIPTGDSIKVENLPKNLQQLFNRNKL